MNIYVIISSFVSGMLGAMGFGGGTVLIIYLTAFLSVEQKQAQGINLVFFIVTGIFALIGNVKKGLIDKKFLKSFLPLSIVGLITGYIILNFISPMLLKNLFGIFLVILSITSLFEKEKVGSSPKKK